MPRTIFTLVLTIAALGLAISPKGLAMIGPNRPALVGALVVLAVLQPHRLITRWRRLKQGDPLRKIPKRPLGI